MILHRGLGMSYRQIIEEFVAPILGSPEHHIEVHHIVHDGIVRPVARLYLTRPTQYRTHDRIEEGGKRVGGSQDDILVVLGVIHLISLAIRAEHQETDVMVIAGAVGNASKGICITFGSRSNGVIMRNLVVHPQDARPESIAPLLRRCLTAVPSLLLVIFQDVARLHRIVVRTIFPLQLRQGTSHLLVTILQLLIDIKSSYILIHLRLSSLFLLLFRRTSLHYRAISQQQGRHKKKYSSYFHRHCFIINTIEIGRILKLTVDIPFIRYSFTINTSYILQREAIAD